MTSEVFSSLAGSVILWTRGDASLAFISRWCSEAGSSFPSLAAPLSLPAPRPAGGNTPRLGRAGPCGPWQEEKPVQPFRELAAISAAAGVTSPGRGIPCRRQLRTETASPACPSLCCPLCCPPLPAPARLPQLPYTTPRLQHPGRLHSLLSIQQQPVPALQI